MVAMGPPVRDAYAVGLDLGQIGLDDAFHSRDRDDIAYSGEGRRRWGEEIRSCRRLQSQGGVVNVKSKALATNARRPNAALGESCCR